MNQEQRMAQEGSGFQGINPESVMKKLQKPLDVQDIDFRVGRSGIKGTGQNAQAWGTLLAYKDSRVDMRRLDESTDGMWSNSYHRDAKGILQCEISILLGKQWVSKVSNGMPSQFEGEKGEYSDAFKRAAFMWGIGRELYDLPELHFYFNNDEVYTPKDADGRPKTDKYGNPVLKQTYNFKPNEWIWTLNWEHEGTHGEKGLIHAKQRGSSSYRIKPQNIFLKHQIRNK